MTSVGFENFWGQVVWSTTNSALLFTLIENLGRKTEISNLEAHAVSEEQISKLEVAMNDLARVHVLHGSHELVDVVTSLNFVKTLATLDQVRERLIGADV